MTKKKTLAEESKDSKKKTKKLKKGATRNDVSLPQVKKLLTTENSKIGGSSLPASSAVTSEPTSAAMRIPTKNPSTITKKGKKELVIPADMPKTWSIGSKSLQDSVKFVALPPSVPLEVI